MFFDVHLFSLNKNKHYLHMLKKRYVVSCQIMDL